MLTRGLIGIVPWVHSIWRTGQAIRLHVTLAILIAIFLALGWWQLRRALAGNTLSWAYTFEWPFFAGYAIYMWWRLLHDQAGEDDMPGQQAGIEYGTRIATDEPNARIDARTKREDNERAVYNAYLAELHASDQEKGR